MRATTTVTTLLFATGALANWNPKICKGAGGCLGISWWPGTDFTCPDNTRLTAQKVAQGTLQLDSGEYELASAAEWPKECLRGVVPPTDSTKVVFTYGTGEKIYSFIIETCRETAPTADCYNQNPNPSGETICQITTADGQFCSQAS